MSITHSTSDDNTVIEVNQGLDRDQDGIAVEQASWPLGRTAPRPDD